MKSRVTLFSMDKNSYPTSCPDDCMHREGTARGYVWWMPLNEDESEAWEPLDHWLCWVRHQANAFRWAWQHTQHKGGQGQQFFEKWMFTRDFGHYYKCNDCHWKIISYNMVKKMTQSGAPDLNVSEQCLHLVVTSFHNSPVMASAPDSIDERIIISTKFCANPLLYKQSASRLSCTSGNNGQED